MGQVRECTECGRRLYSLAEKNWNCKDRDAGICPGVMRLVTMKTRPRNVWGGASNRKLGEFW